MEEKILPSVKNIEEGTLSDSIDPTKPIEEAAMDAQSEMSAEDQQKILKEIIRQTKMKTMSRFSGAGKMISPEAAKKRKAKIKAQKRARKANRKK